MGAMKNLLIETEWKEERCENQLAETAIRLKAIADTCWSNGDDEPVYAPKREMLNAIKDQLDKINLELRHIESAIDSSECMAKQYK